MRWRQPEEPEIHAAERMVFFSDAVVAIAMTLLILPLMESVSEAASEHLSAAEWLSDHSGQVIGFALSFVLVASFWRGHHALYDHVELMTQRLMWLNFGWLFTIVVLPVATALATSLASQDRVSIAIYIGTLISTAGMATLVQVYLLRHRELWKPGGAVTINGLVINLALLILFVVALLLALLVPGIDYLALFVLVLVAPLTAVLRRWIRWDLPAAPAGTDPDR